MKLSIASAIAALVLSQSAFAAGPWRYESQPGSASANRIGSAELIDGQAERLDFNVPSRVEYVRYTQELRNIRVRDVSCTQGFTYSNTWNGYFTATSSDSKARILAGLVQGIGPARARKLVQGNAFAGSYPPASWDAFKQIIDTHDRYDGLRGLYNDVVIEFGEANRTRLGYTNCVWLDTYHYEDRWVEVRQVDHSRTRTEYKAFVVNVSGGALLPGERESMTAYYDWDSNTTSLDVAEYYNTYNLGNKYDEGRSVTYNFSLARRRVQPPAAYIQASAAVQNLQVQVVANTSISERVLSHPGLGTPMLKLKLEKINPGVSRNQNLPTPDYALNRGGSTTVNTTVNPGNSVTGVGPWRRNVPGKVEVKYGIKFTGSRFYNDTMSPDQRFGEVTFPLQ